MSALKWFQIREVTRKVHSNSSVMAAKAANSLSVSSKHAKLMYYNVEFCGLSLIDTCLCQLFAERGFVKNSNLTKH